MNDKPVDEGKRASFADVSDWTLKVVAISAPLSLVMGTLFNVAFFAGLKANWLFHLSILDNLTATLFVLPLVMGVVGICLVYALFFARIAGSGRQAALLLAAIVLLFMAMTWISSPHPFAIGMIFQFVVFLVITGCLWGGARLLAKSQVPSRNVASSGTLLGGGLIALALAVSTVYVARGVRSAIDANIGEHDIAIEIAGGMIEGRLVRFLDGGVIVAQGKLWTFVPRSEIKQLRELPASNLWDRMSRSLGQPK